MLRLATALCLTVSALACVAPPPAPTLDTVTPDTLAVDGGEIVLGGVGWLPAGTFDFDTPAKSSWDSTVSLSATGPTGQAYSVDATWRSTTRVEANVPSGWPPGLYSLELITPRGVHLQLADALTILDEAVEPDAGMVMPCTTTTYADDDRDGFGQPGTAAQLCGAGRVDNADDCNDADALTNPNGTEVCNGLDDDCDGTVDDGVCSSDGGLTLTTITTLRDPENDFVAVSAFSADEAWLATRDTLWLYRPDAGFRQRQNNCPSNINALWADPNGRVFVAGGNNGVGRITVANVVGNGCADETMLPDPVVGLTGFSQGDAGWRVEGLLRDGRRFSWDGRGTPAVSGSGGLVLSAGDGASVNTFYGMGRTVNASPVLAVRVRGDGSSVTERTLDAGLGFTSLSSPNPQSAVAVGNDGLVWRRLPRGEWEQTLAPGPIDFTTVQAFSAGRFIASSTDGGLYRYGGAWNVTPTDPNPVRAMDAFTEANLWLVGDNGFILRVR